MALRGLSILGGVSRYGYALFFAVMTGGVTAGIGGVVLGEITDDAGWAPLASGLAGLCLAVVVYLAVLRAATSTLRDD